MIHPLWYFCICIRLLLTLNLKKYYKLSKYIILTISCGFAYKALTGSNNETQIAQVFWHNVRFIHSILFFLAYLQSTPRSTTLILICDIIFSIIYRIYLESNL